MEILSSSETVILDLCECTSVTAGLLTELELFGLITDELGKTIKQENDSKTQAKWLFNFLKKSGKNDVSKLKVALKRTANQAAVDVLEKAEKNIAAANPRNETQIKKMEITMRTVDIGNFLGDDPSVLSDIKTLHTRFNVGYGKVMSALNLVDMNIKQPGAYIGEMLTIWRGGVFEDQAKGVHLLRILMDEGYASAAETLKKKGLADETQITNV